MTIAKQGLIIITVGIGVALAVFMFSSAKASTVSDSKSGLPVCDVRGGSGTCLHSVYAPANHQAYLGTFRGDLEGHGAFGPAGGKGGVLACLSRSNTMWEAGSSCWQIVDDRGEGDVGDGRLLGINQSRDIGADYRPPFSWWTVEVYVNDATFYNMSIGVEGRKVEVTNFSKSADSVLACAPFNISWDVDYAHTHTFFWATPDNGGSGPVSASDTQTFSSCTPGTAFFTIRGDGSAGNAGGGVDEESLTVQIVAAPLAPPPPPPGPSPLPPPGPGPVPPPPPLPGTVSVRTYCSGIETTSNVTVNYTIPSGSSSATISTPYVLPSADQGAYTLGYVLGGPPGCSFQNITPSSTQTLSAGGGITFNLNFLRPTAPPPPGPGPVPPPPPPPLGLNNLYCDVTQTGAWEATGNCVVTSRTTPFMLGAITQGDSLEYIKNDSSYICNEGWSVGSCGSPGVDGFYRFGNRTLAADSGPDPNLVVYQSRSRDSGITNTVRVRYIPSGIIKVISSHPLGSWVISGPSTVFGSGNGTFNYSGRPPGGYTLTPGNLAGYSPTVTPSATGTLSSDGTLTFNLDYSATTGTVAVNANISSGSWVIRNSLGTEVGTGSGSSPISYTLNVGNYTVTANPVAGYNSPSPNPRTLLIREGSNAPVVLDYTLVDLRAPIITGLDNSNCEQIRITWRDVSSSEQGYTVWRRTESGPLVQISRNLPPNTTSYTDPSGANLTGTIPVPGQIYYYVVKAFTDVPFYRESASSELGPVLNIECRPNIVVDKNLTRVIKGPFPPGTESTYTSSTIIEDGDVLRFSVTISNTGTASGRIISVTYFPCVNLAPPCRTSNCKTGSVSNPWNLRIDKDGDGVYNELSTIYGREAGSVTGSAPNYSIVIPGGWGNKPVGGTNWLVFMDMAVISGGTTSFDSFSNTTCATYELRDSTGRACDTFGPILFKTGTPRVPDFDEVAP